MESDQPAVQRHVLAAQAEKAAADFAVFDEPCSDVFCSVNADSEANALRRQDHGRIHAHDFATRIHEWSARIAGIEGSVRLNHIVHEPAGTGAEGPANGADNPRGDGGLKAVRISNSNGQLSYSRVSGLAKAHRMELRRIDAHDGEIGI